MQEIKRINEELSMSNEKLEQAYLDIIQTLRYTVEAKDPYTRGHSDRVAEYSVLIGEKVGLSEEELKRRKNKKYELKKALKGCTYRRC